MKFVSALWKLVLALSSGFFHLASFVFVLWALLLVLMVMSFRIWAECHFGSNDLSICDLGRVSFWIWNICYVGSRAFVPKDDVMLDLGHLYQEMTISTYPF